MKRETELDLIDQVLTQLATDTPDMIDRGGYAPVSEYTDADRYQSEQDLIFKQFPVVLAHCSELVNTGDFITRDFAGRSLILMRGDDGKVRAFLNACRHTRSPTAQ